MSSRIASYDVAMDKDTQERMKRSCAESQYIGSRSTNILGDNCRKLTDRGTNDTEMDKFVERHIPMSACQCDGHHCMRTHSLVAILSFLSLLYIDPETTE